MKKKHNLFAVVEKGTNRAVALANTAVSLYFKHNTPMYDVLPVANTGVTSHRTDSGTITSMSIWIDSEEEPVYYLVTNWPNEIAIGEAYKIICDERAN